MPYVGWKVFLVLRDIVTNGGFAFWVSFATNVLYNIKRPRKVYVEHDYVSVANMYSFKANWFLNINRYLVNKIFDVGQIFFFVIFPLSKKAWNNKFFISVLFFSRLFKQFKVCCILWFFSYWNGLLDGIILSSLRLQSGVVMLKQYSMMRSIPEISMNIFTFIKIES